MDNFKLLILLQVFIYALQALSTCTVGSMPYVLGGIYGDTEFSAFDIDSDGYIVAGGDTLDEGMLGILTSTSQPIIVLYYPDTTIDWAY
jgi:hypothetical protein